MNPEAKILVCGCASQNSPESFKKDGVIYISGTANKTELINHIENLEFDANIDVLPLKYEEDILETVAMLIVQLITSVDFKEEEHAIVHERKDARARLEWVTEGAEGGASEFPGSLVVKALVWSLL